MNKSLYSVLGKPTQEHPNLEATRTSAPETIDCDEAGRLAPVPASVGTIVTKQVETLDNDVALVVGEVLHGRDARRNPHPRPGTVFTEAVETIDNDVAIEASHLALGGGPDPRRRPEPGTTVIFTTETTDESGSASISLLP